MSVLKAKFCRDCGAPAKHNDPYEQCEECWEEWWLNEKISKKPKQNKKQKWDDE